MLSVSLTKPTFNQHHLLPAKVSKPWMIWSETKQNDDHTYAQVKEITGITDRTKIHEAINACRNNEGKYEVSEVVNKLLFEVNPQQAKKNKVSMAITQPKDTVDTVDAVAGREARVAETKDKKVVDLTSDSNESEDIQKAIAASLQDSGVGETAPVQETSGILGGQVSREEQDISRVLEQSLIESKAGTKRKRGDIWFVDPLNPHERKRHDNWPVGLKNVGNTCWFSAVIQSLFLLRRFRHLVLNYKAAKELNQACVQERRNLRFMQELRHLFALMIGTKRKYVDPSKAVDILKEAFSTHTVSNSGVTDSQQDVSEFQHKLLEWLEDAFKSESRLSSTEEQSDVASDKSRISKNPMADLFYGMFRADGFNEGKVFSKEENFGQFPLQVEGFKDIHESLEAATALREIESVNSDSTQKSGQELWFTRLPPVLTFELSRFQFSQQLGRPEKIHHKIEFPQVIYMDRYMDCNREETRRRRDRAKKLKEELGFLQAKLDKFINYGSGVKRFPLQDVLLYALEFAKTRPDPPRRHVTTTHDVDMESPSPNTSGMVVDSPVKSPMDVTASRITSPTPTQPSPDKNQVTQNSASLPIPHVTMSPASVSNTPPDIAMVTETASPKYPTLSSPLQSPYPRHISEGEMEVLQSCLHRWRTEVESDVRELQENISALEDSINQMYGDEQMKKHAYSLHAVLVHEGQAASGHYWAYVYDLSKERWLKFNDITVTEASWEELEKESVGGYHNASAYCLMYINNASLTPDKEEPGNKLLSDGEILPNDLSDVVDSDNRLFSDEIDKWDKDLARKAFGSGDSSVTVIEDTKPHKPALPSGSSSSVSTQTIQPKASRIAAVHATISFNESLSALITATESDAFAKNSLDEALNNALNLEYKRIQDIVVKLPTSFPLSDPRLKHIVTYTVYCESTEDVLKLILLEQFAEISCENNERVKLLKEHAGKLVKKIMADGGESVVKQNSFWHETYQMFIKTAAMFIKGVTVYFDEKYEMALPYLLHSHLLSEELRKARHKNAGLAEPKLSAFFLRQTLLHINDTITESFEDQFDVTDLLQEMSKTVLPCLQVLSQSEYPEDVSAIEDIRGKWCSFLGKEMEDVKIEQLQDFLSKLFEPPPDLRVPKMPSMRTERLQDLHKQYESVMKVVSESGYVERAIKGS